MTAVLLGLLGVGIAMGLVLGRDSERARRSYKDFRDAKAAVKGGRTAVWVALRRALLTVLWIAFALVLALILGFEIPP